VRCSRCPREAAAVVEIDDERRTTAACLQHLEWAFLAGLDEWPQRRPTA
jgi:hypothetical protein